MAKIKAPLGSGLRTHFSPFDGLCILGIIVASIVASFNTLDVQAYILHQVGTVIFTLALIYFTCTRPISSWAFFLASVFIVLHIVGAHYLYSYVPYNEIIFHYTGFDLNAIYGWHRNMYDRLIHFSYGLLLYPLFRQIFSSWFPQAPIGRVALLAIMFVMASSMVYELIEWLTAITMSPTQAELYNGQQGDFWDAQKDMAMASVGAIIAWFIDRFNAALRKH